MRSTGGNVGGLVGWHIEGSISNCYSTGDVNGGSDVGGLVGNNFYGSISNCYSTGDVSGYSQVGGLVGENFRYSSVSNCYSTGDVSGQATNVGGLVGLNEGSASNCYSTGDVSGVNRVGGLVGSNYEGSVSSCFWDTDAQTHGVTVSIGYNTGTVTNVAGLPTAKMQTKSTFTAAGWDFTGETINGTDDIWRMCIDWVDYPHLTWKFAQHGDFVCPDGVNFTDYCFFAERWRDTNCGYANDCDGTDLDFSDRVNWADLKIFCDHWLEGKSN